MTNELTMIDTSTNKRNEMFKSMIDLEYYPVPIENQSVLVMQTKISLSKVTALGTAFGPLTEIFQNVVGKENLRTGLYKVTVPEGRTLGDLAKFQDGKGYLGSVLKDGAVGGGQAVLNPITFNPTMLFVAAALTNIDKKLDNIQEIQQEILNFLIQKERSELKGDLNFLSDVLNNYKYNWNNEKYKNSNHIKVLDIKQSSERKIDFYRERIISKINKGTFIKYNKGVEKEMKVIESEFKDYQLSMYLYAFSSFLEIILLENYDSQYLKSISKKIEDYSFEYRDLYSRSYIQIEKNSKNSVENKLLRLGSNLSNLTGGTINKIPVINKSNIEKTLIKVGDDLKTKSYKKTDKIIQLLIERQSSYVRPFVENINEINELYNKPLELLFDKDNIYIGVQ